LLTCNLHRYRLRGKTQPSSPQSSGQQDNLGHLPVPTAPSSYQGQIRPASQPEPMKTHLLPVSSSAPRRFALDADRTNPPREQGTASPPPSRKVVAVAVARSGSPRLGDSRTFQNDLTAPAGGLAGWQSPPSAGEGGKEEKKQKGCHLLPPGLAAVNLTRPFHQSDAIPSRILSFVDSVSTKGR
jgi:hypothetical protein